MCNPLRDALRRRLILLVCLVLMLSLVSNASAQLLVHYKLDETSGSIAVDTSGKGNDGTIEGTPSWVTGWLDGALEFDGSLSVTLPAENMGLRSDTGSVAFWMNMVEVTGGINTIWWGGDNSYRMLPGSQPVSKLTRVLPYAGQFWGEVESQDQDAHFNLCALLESLMVTFTKHNMTHSQNDR